MDIKYHKLTDVPYKQTPNGGGIYVPNYIVMHYTAGYNMESAISRFLDKSSQVSAHLTIDRDGSVVQVQPFNVKCWHAGPSRYKGVEMMNAHAIGIEHVNIGWLKKTATGLLDAYGNTLKMDKFDDYVIGPNARVGGGDLYWPVYTKKQLEVSTEITKLIIANYDIKDIVSHEEIDTRGWKTDPGPAFPMASFKALLKGYTSNATPAADEHHFKVNTPSLNVRGGPGTNFPVISGLKAGDTVVVTDTSGGWSRINVNGADGWVRTTYLSK